MYHVMAGQMITLVANMVRMNLPGLNVFRTEVTMER